MATREKNTGDDLQKKQERAADLRSKIRDERVARENLAVEQSTAQQDAQLDTELERLQAQLEAEKALTAAQKKSGKIVQAGTAADTQAQAESTQRTAERIASSPEQLTAEGAGDTDKTKEN